MTSLRHCLNAATAVLSTAGVDAPRLSAQVLAAHALACTKIDLNLRAEQALSEKEQAAVQALIARRAKGEPVAYIIGKRDFYGRDFTVTGATLIPRPETEEMVERALHECKKENTLFADIGTGSGCIAVTLAAERPDWRGIMLDISKPALTVATRNAAAHGVGDKILAVHGDLQSPPLAKEAFDCVISNPPYVSGTEMTEISHEVRDFEPHSALTPEPTGLQHIAAIAKYAFHLLRPGGICLVEHGYAQGAAVLELFQQGEQAKQGDDWKELRICRDLAGNDRHILCRK